MKKNIHWATFTDTDVESSSNRVDIKAEIKGRKLKVEVVDKNGNKIKRYLEVRDDEHKILLTPNFQLNIDDYKETGSDQIEYLIKRDDNCWSVNKDEITIKPGKMVEFEKTKKEIHKNLLKEKFEITNDRREVEESSDMKYIIMDDEKGGYEVKIYCGDTNKDKKFSWEKIEIEPRYWVNKQVSFDNMFNVKYPEEKEKSRLTKGWVVFFIIIGIVVILGIIFQKKIWRWVKGEREQEKKVREQIDIF